MHSSSFNKMDNGKFSIPKGAATQLPLILARAKTRCSSILYAKTIVLISQVNPQTVRHYSASFFMKIHILRILFLSLILIIPASGQSPDYTGIDYWPTAMAFVHLKNAGITTNDKIDFTKTKTVRLASEKIAKDLYRQIHRVVFTEKSGKTIDVITINNVSREEGSMSTVQFAIFQ